MKLLGDWNWWLPGWLDRLLPNLDVEGGTGLPEPEYEPGRGPAIPPGPAAPDGEREPEPAFAD
jgi:RND superfamily putative drug exporter